LHQRLYDFYLEIRNRARIERFDKIAIFEGTRIDCPSKWERSVDIAIDDQSCLPTFLAPIGNDYFVLLDLEGLT